MIEHPIPQNVTSYQFHLVGDMTLKQFVELAAGIVLAWIVWQLGLPDIFKLPLAGLTALLGFALAFLPIEDRPLDQWLLSFVRAIYSPTILMWKRSPREDLLQFKPRAPEKKEALESALKTPATGLQTLLETYQSQARGDEETDPLEEPWRARRKTLPNLFATVLVPRKLQMETTFPKKRARPPERPETTVSPRPLGPPENPAAVLRGEITLPPRQVKVPPQMPVAVRTQVATREEAQAPQPPTSAVHPVASTEQPLQSPPIARSVPPPAPSVGSAPTPATIPLPTASTYSNMLSGIVFGSDGHVVENAIIEIRDANNLPIRALKTNQLGQFMVATPLTNGTYVLEIEKDGDSFDILRIEAKGNIMAPIEIRAKQP